MRLGVTVFLTDKAIGPASLAREVEERGFSSLFVPEHTHLPLRADRPPALVDGVDAQDYRRGLDPLVALMAAAGSTTRLRLGTGVLLVAQHDPIVLAKQVATLDHLSSGRVVLGVGFGWNRAEAEDHGVDFGLRRTLAAEHVACLRALWGQDQASYHGTMVDLPPCWSWPKPAQGAALPVLLGGGATDTVFEAICAWADGWLPIGGAGLAEALPRLWATAERRGRDPSSLQVVPFGTVPNEAKLERYASLGLKEVVLRVRSGPAAEVLGELDRHARFLDLVGGGER